MKLTFERPELSARTSYALNPLDRLTEKREDAQNLQRLRAEPTTRLVLVGADGGILLHADGGDPFFTFDEARRATQFHEPVLLGRDGSGVVFAALYDAAKTPAQAQAIDLRAIAVEERVENGALGLLAEAKSIVLWHARHRFCANCGAPTKSFAGGWRRECAACGAQHFPRTDPVVLMLTTDGDSCLLGRQARFAPGMYSALAGFVEPGETVEDAVRREVREETGVLVGAVAYAASQPWPFPSSLMLGCIAQASTREITLDHLELEDARWVDRAEARMMIAGTHPDGLRAPNRIAIAYRLLEFWLET